jgi:hypothetical protein
LFFLAFVLCWFVMSVVMMVCRSSTPDQQWSLTMRNGYWWREYQGRDDRIETLGHLERIGPYRFGIVSIQTTSGDYHVRYDGRTGDINGLFSANGEEITRHYTIGPNLPFRLPLHFIGTVLGLVSVLWSFKSLVRRSKAW